MDKQLIKTLQSIYEFMQTQKKFDDITTEKFNEIINKVNELEERIKKLEDEENIQTNYY